MYMLQLNYTCFQVIFVLPGYKNISSGAVLSNVFEVATPGTNEGGLAQLARALAWHARGHRFEPGILH